MRILSPQPRPHYFSRLLPAFCRPSLFTVLSALFYFALRSLLRTSAPLPAPAERERESEGQSEERGEYYSKQDLHFYDAAIFYQRHQPERIGISFIYIYIYKYMGVCVCLYLCICVFVGCGFVCLWVCVFVCLWVCGFVGLWVCGYKVHSSFMVHVVLSLNNYPKQLHGMQLIKRN